MQQALHHSPSLSRCCRCSSKSRSCRVVAAAAGNGRQQQQQISRKQYDLLGLSNLCVDVVVPVDNLPGGEDERLQLLHKVTGRSAVSASRPPGAATAAADRPISSMPPGPAADSSSTIGGALGGWRQLQRADSRKFQPRRSNAAAPASVTDAPASCCRRRGWA